jgi:hypothetical protein
MACLLLQRCIQSSAKPGRGNDSAYEGPTPPPPHHHHHHPRRARYQVAAAYCHVRVFHVTGDDRITCELCALHILDAPGRLSDYDAAWNLGVRSTLAHVLLVSTLHFLFLRNAVSRAGAVFF